MRVSHKDIKVVIYNIDPDTDMYDTMKDIEKELHQLWYANGGYNKDRIEMTVAMEYKSK